MAGLNWHLSVTKCFHVKFFFSSLLADKKPTAADINVYTIKMRDGKPMKVVKMTIVNVWKQGNKIRINNFGDKDSTAHPEKDIRSQVRKFQNLKSNIINCFCTSCVNIIVFREIRQQLKRKRLLICYPNLKKK